MEGAIKKGRSWLKFPTCNTTPARVPPPFAGLFVRVGVTSATRFVLIHKLTSAQVADSRVTRTAGSRCSSPFVNQSVPSPTLFFSASCLFAVLLSLFVFMLVVFFSLVALTEDVPDDDDFAPLRARSPFRKILSRAT